MKFSIITLFPEYFEQPLKSSLLGRAVQSGKLVFEFVGLREFGEGKYRAVDDRPYGGGPGMVLMAPVIEKAMQKAGLTLESKSADASERPYVVYLSPQGKKLTNQLAKTLAEKRDLVLLCGHYEGVDERAIEAFVDEEVSIGDYILTGGEPAALVVIDAVSRFVPGVVGEEGSVSGDTFEKNAENADCGVSGGLKAPSYTRPPEWQGRAIPEVLLSGNHGEIARWRRAQSEKRTLERRPDLSVVISSKKRN